MTREEALEELDSLLIPRDGEQDKLADAFEMAIKALSQQTEDAISRQAAINAVCDSDCHINHRDCGLYSGRCFTVWRLEKLPSVIPSRPTEPCEDAISRQAAIEKIHWLGLDNDTAIKCDLALRALPSVNPQELSDISEVSDANSD